MKTVGFFKVLQPRPETKLHTPWTTHWPLTLQLRGPPESPCKNLHNPERLILLNTGNWFPPSSHTLHRSDSFEHVRAQPELNFDNFVQLKHKLGSQ